jgi:hypothetical protein
MAKSASFVRSGVCGALALVVLAGCGSSEQTALQVVQAAATETAHADTARMLMTIESDGLTTGDQPALTANGVVDFGETRGRFTIDFGKITNGLIDGEAEYLFDATTIYFRFPPGIASELPGDTPWWRFDFTDVGDEIGVDLDSLAQFRSNDPTAVLQYLRGSGEVIEVRDNEIVRGARTTHYKAALDLTKAREQVPDELQQAYDQATAQLGVDTLPAEVWVDEEGRLRMLTFTVDLAKAALPNGAKATGTLRMTMELYQFGVDADLSPPPADQVGDLETLISRQAGGS